MSARRRASLGCTLPTRCRVGQPINHSGKLQAPNVGRPTKVRYLQCRPYLTVCPSLGLSLSRGDVLRAHMPRTRTGHECSRGRAYASESRCRRMDAWFGSRGDWRGAGARGPGGPGTKGGSGRGASLLENDRTRGSRGSRRATCCRWRGPGSAVCGSAPAWQRPGRPCLAGSARRRRSTATTQMATGDRSVAPGNAQLTCRACFASHPILWRQTCFGNCLLVCPFSQTPAICIF
jgi:hypothetical protein